MKQSRFILTFLALCSVALQGCAGYSTEDHSVNIPTYTECGGVIPLIWNDKGASARVSYKNGTLFSPIEFCVWTFFAENAAGEVTLEFRENIQESLDGIVVYTFKDSDFTFYKIPHGNSELRIESQHFAVAFSSDTTEQSNGFYFDVIVEKAGDGRKNPKAFFSRQNTSEFTYPKDIGHDYYNDNEQVSVVLHGPDATKDRHYVLRDLDTEQHYDVVGVYALQPYYFDDIRYVVGRFTGQKSGDVPNSGFHTNTPVLCLFSSDGKGTGKGFTIKWE